MQLVVIEKMPDARCYMPRMPDRLPADPRRSGTGTGQVRVELELFGVVPVVLCTECPMSDPNRPTQPPLVGFSVLRCKPAITTDSQFADHSIGT